SFCPDGKTLVYAAGESEDETNIFVRRLSDDLPYRLNHDPGRDDQPACSPDGKQVAFIHFSPAGPGADQSIRFIHLDGSGDHEIFCGQYLHTLGWGVDGSRLIVSQGGPLKTPYRLRALNVASGAVRDLLTPHPKSLGDVRPALSPDGRTLVFVRQHNRVT